MQTIVPCSTHELLAWKHCLLFAASGVLHNGCCEQSSAQTILLSGNSLLHCAHLAIGLGRMQSVMAMLPVQVRTDPVVITTGSAEGEQTAARFGGAQQVMTAVACGARHTCCVGRMGQLFCWGWSLHGQCGQGRAVVSVPQPQDVRGACQTLHAVLALACAVAWYCAFTIRLCVLRYAMLRFAAETMMPMRIMPS